MVQRSGHVIKVYLTFLTRIEVLVTIERLRNRGYRYLQIDAACIIDGIITDNFCTSHDHAVIEVITCNLHAANEAIILNVAFNVAFPKLEIDGIRRMCTNVLGRTEDFLSLGRQSISLTHQIIQNRSTACRILAYLDANGMRCQDCTNRCQRIRNLDFILFQRNLTALVIVNDNAETILTAFVQRHNDSSTIAQLDTARRPASIDRAHFKGISFDFLLQHNCNLSLRLRRTSYITESQSQCRIALYLLTRSFPAMFLR